MIIDLRITDYRQLHVYGSLRAVGSNADSILVEYELLPHHVRRFKRETGERYKVGETTERFWTKDELVERALEVAHAEFPGLQAVIIDCNIYQPSEPAWCRDLETFAKLKSMYDRFEGYFQEGEEAPDSIYTDWAVALKPLLLEKS